MRFLKSIGLFFFRSMRAGAFTGEVKRTCHRVRSKESEDRSQERECAGLLL